MADEKEKKSSVKVEWKGLLNPLLSLFDKEIRIWIRRKASSIPEESKWRTSEIHQRGLDVGRGFLERNVHFENDLLETLKEKLTDYGDYLASNLQGEDGARRGAPNPSWMDDFLAEASDRLSRAEDMGAEFDKLKLELEARLRAEGMADELRKLAQPERPAKEPTDWRRRFYGTKRKPGPIPKLKRKAKRADVRSARRLRNMNHRLEGWLDERGA